MAVIRDVMPVFELFQPATIDDALKLLDKHGADALGAGGRARHVRLAEGSHEAAERGGRPEPDRASCAGSRKSNGGLEIGAMTPLTEVVKHPVVRRSSGC